MQKVCPILASGWLGNKYASLMGSNDAGESPTFRPANLPRCLRENCMAWRFGDCRLIPAGYLVSGVVQP